MIGKLLETDNGDFDFGDKDGVGCGEGLLFDNEEDAAAAAAAASAAASAAISAGLLFGLPTLVVPSKTV